MLFQVGLIIIKVFPHLVVCFALFTWSSAQALGAIESPQMQRLDAHVQQVTKRRDISLDDRFAALLSGSGSDHETAWLIYRWVTQHFKHDNLLASRIGDPGKLSLEDLYKLGGGSCAVYANVIHRLMVRAGLEVKTIYGIAKGGVATATVSGKPVNHVWNALKVNGEWRVIDATWGAGYVGTYGFQRQQSDLFFLIPQHLSVLSHFDAADELGYQRKFGMDYKLFIRIPEDAMYVASVGFDSSHILAAQRRTFVVPLVGTFDQPPGTFKVLKAPVVEQISRDSLKFKIQSGAYEELMLVQGQSWQPLNKQGNTFSLSMRPAKGELLVMGRKAKQHDYEALLAYTVK